MIIVDLIYNLSVLVALSVLSGFIDTRYDRRKMPGKVLQGLLFGAVVIVGMMYPFVMTEGIIFDGRSIVISLCTLFFGPIAGLISSVIGIIFRVYLGGSGALMGTLVITESFLIGYLFFYFRKKGSIKLTNLNLYIFGVIVNFIMMVLIITLPTKFVAETFKLITITVIGVYPIITLLIGKVLSDQEDNRKFIGEIKKSEEKYKSTTENSYNLIALLDLNGKYLYCNHSYKDVLGYNPEDLIGKKCFDLAHPDEVENVFKLFTEGLKNGVKTGSLQIKIRCFDGSYKLLNHRVKVIENESKKPEKILLVGEDITEQKKAEDDLVIAKERAEESDRLKTAFLQNMSHEIRTPLNGILGFADLIQNDNLDKNDLKKYSRIIRSSGKRLLELINNIIDVSRIETGNITIYITDISINALFKDLIKQFELKARDKGVELNLMKSYKEKDVIVASDNLKLRQILNNLVNNALKFTNKGSVEIGYELKNDEILFIVKDTGVGVVTEQKERIFERFYQPDMSMSRGFEGAGLGLSICKGLVELLKGRIWLESEPGVGTTFYFTIPIETGRNDILKNKVGKIMDNNGKLILIAEDDETSYVYLSMILKKENYKVLRALNGKNAIELCHSREDIALVLMDIKMPVMNGLLATESIKKDKPNLPVIAQTAYAFSMERQEAIKAGCDDYITKPIDKEYLFELITKYI